MWPASQAQSSSLLQGLFVYCTYKGPQLDPPHCEQQVFRLCVRRELGTSGISDNWKLALEPDISAGVPGRCCHIRSLESVTGAGVDVRMSDGRGFALLELEFCVLCCGEREGEGE